MSKHVLSKSEINSKLELRDKMPQPPTRAGGGVGTGGPGSSGPSA